MWRECARLTQESSITWGRDPDMHGKGAILGGRGAQFKVYGVSAVNYLKRLNDRDAV